MEKPHHEHKQHTLNPQNQNKQKQDHVSLDRAQAKARSLRRAQAPVIREVVDNEVMKLAATAISLNVRLRSSSNMPHHMQNRALRRTRSLIDASSSSSKPPMTSSKPRPNSTHLARALKKEFDELYGPAWHCVVGKSFGSFVTHSPGGFLYFSIDDSLSVLLFKTEVEVVITEQQPRKSAVISLV